jgi:large subunit ribosomal protein L4
LCLNEYTNEEIKTKKAFEVLSKLEINSQKILLVVDSSDVVIKKSFRNIPNVKYMIADYLNVADLLSYKKILFLSNALDSIEKNLSK